MTRSNSPLSPDRWVADIFASKAAREGRVVRRSYDDIEKYGGVSRFTTEVARRGYTAVLNGDQVVIFCNQEKVRRFV